MATIQTVDPADTLAVLKAAEEWLKDPGHWTRMADWRDADGVATQDREDVVATCANGALAFVVGANRSCGWPETAWSTLRDALGVKSVAAVNDSEDGHPRVMAGLRKAIETVEAKDG